MCHTEKKFNNPFRTNEIEEKNETRYSGSSNQHKKYKTRNNVDNVRCKTSILT